MRLRAEIIKVTVCIYATNLHMNFRSIPIAVRVRAEHIIETDESAHELPNRDKDVHTVLYSLL